MINIQKAKRSVCVWAMVIMSSIPGMGVAAPGQTWTFSNCGIAGRIGPAQGDCNTAYVATSLAGNVVVTAGVQAWQVPVTGTYRFEALGAAGGTQTFGGPASSGGLGASMAGDIDLVGGETILFIVGQKGEDTFVALDNAAPGGGGGTFVYRSAADPAPLIAAGGGGAGSSCIAIPVPANRHANAATNGNDSGSGANGGAAGNGGRNNVFPADWSYWAGGGTGWLTDGTGGNNPVDYDYTMGSSGAEGGRTPLNGALGGLRHEDGNPNEGGAGGFGGGGGGGSDNMGTGGGGGYSGGGGGGGAPIDLRGPNECNNAPGGGGGSYNSGINQLNTAASNAGHGQVVVTQLTGAATPVPAMSVWSLIVLAGLLGLVGFSRYRRHKFLS